MTAEQFDALPVMEDGPDYELLDGELIEVSSASLRHNRIVGLLSYYLNHFLLQNQWGIVAADSELQSASIDCNLIWQSYRWKNSIEWGRAGALSGSYLISLSKSLRLQNPQSKWSEKSPHT